MSRRDDIVSLRQMLDHIEIPATDFPLLAEQIRSLLGAVDESSEQDQRSPP